MVPDDGRPVEYFDTVGGICSVKPRRFLVRTSTVGYQLSIEDGVSCWMPHEIRPGEVGVYIYIYIYIEREREREREREIRVCIGSCFCCRVQELCESGGGRHGILAAKSPYGPCGRTATLNERCCAQNSRALLKKRWTSWATRPYSPCTVSVDVKQR